jgi:cytochrome c-type biogenesis protein CcmH
MRVRAAPAVLVVVLAMAAASASAMGVAGAPVRANFPDVQAQYMCVSCNVPLPEAESDQAGREDALLRRLIKAGDTPAQIQREMVAVFTDKVLALPPRKGFNLVAYVIPVVAVIALVVALLLVLPRWRRRSVEVPAAVALGDADRVRLDADLARFDP